MEVIERSMSSSRQAGNHGKLGFVPTSKAIVEMEMNLIDFSELENNDFPINICDLSGGEGDQIHWTHEHLEEKGIKTSVFYNELDKTRFTKCVEKYPYMNKLNEDIFKLKVGKKVQKSFNKKVFSIIRNNPPYMYIERRGQNVRAEIEFFEKNSLMEIEGAIHILEVPYHQLREIPNFVSRLAYRYEFEIFKFPKGEFEKFKQVVVLCKRKKQASTDKEKIERTRFLLDNDLIPYLDETKRKIFKVSRVDFSKTPEINIYRSAKVTEGTLFNGLKDVVKSLLSSDKKDKKQLVADENLRPIIELMPGHISQNLAAGLYNGVMGNLLIKGGSIKSKEVKVIKEEGKTTTVTTDVIKPYLELTNKEGLILFKDL